MRIGSAFLQTFLVQVTQSAASILTGVLIARGLGPAGQGRYAVFAAAVALGVVLGSLGQFESNVLSSAGRLGSGPVLLGRSIAQSAALALLMGLVVASWRLTGRGGPLAELAVPFVAVLTLEVEAQLLRGINLGQHHITGYNLSTLIQRAVYLLGVVLLALAASLTLGHVLASWTVATLVSVVLTGWWVWARSGGIALGARDVFAGWTVALGRGLRALVTLAVTLLLVRCDIWMLGPLVGVRMVGQMSVAIGLAEWLWYVPYILGSVLFAAAAADEQRAVSQICRASRAVVALIGPVALLLVVFGRGLVPLVYGTAYEPAGLLFVTLIPGMAAIAVHIVVDSFFAGRGFPPISVWSAAGALAAKVGLNLMVIPLYGAVGAASVTTFVYAALLTVKVIAFSRATGTPLGLILKPTAADIRENFAFVIAWLRERLGLVPARVG